METERKLQEISGSLLISLPKEWANSFHLHKGSKVKIITVKNGLITLSPLVVAEGKKEDAVILYDKYFLRNFFRQYFLGYEMIIVKFPVKNQDDRLRVYAHLKRFMNVQVIEEKEDSLVIKCFKIEELSIKECLNRMHFLSLTMMGEVLKDNNPDVLQEISENLTRFYYMLVMQVRRFIDEGKFTEQNQISLLHALDCRMVAEKVKRICDLVRYFSSPLDNEVGKLFDEVKDNYAKGYQYFYNHEFDKAIHISDKEQLLRSQVQKMEELSEKRKNIAKFKQADALSQILKNSQSIVMLTR